MDTPLPPPHPPPTKKKNTIQLKHLKKKKLKQHISNNQNIQKFQKENKKL